MQKVFFVVTILHMTIQTYSKKGITKGFGERLKLERKRLKLSQEALAQAGGVQRLAQIQYETENTAPTTRYLNLIGKTGVDLTFLFFGIDSNHEDVSGERLLALEEKTFELISRYAKITKTEKLSPETFKMLFNVIRGILLKVEQGKLSKDTDIMSIIQGR